MLRHNRSFIFNSDPWSAQPVTIEEGTNMLAGTSRSTILAAWNKMRVRPKTGRIRTFGMGLQLNVSQCLEIISSRAHSYERFLAAH